MCVGEDCHSPRAQHLSFHSIDADQGSATRIRAHRDSPEPKLSRLDHARLLHKDSKISNVKAIPYGRTHKGRTDGTFLLVDPPDLPTYSPHFALVDEITELCNRQITHSSKIAQRTDEALANCHSDGTPRDLFNHRPLVSLPVWGFLSSYGWAHEEEEP